MIKIKSIKFKDHKILGNLELDFCDKDGNPADTIIIAGENGTGKTTILEEIHKIMDYKTDCQDLELSVETVNDYSDKLRNYDLKYGNTFFRLLPTVEDVSVNHGIDNLITTFKQGADNFIKSMNFKSIYSTVNINFSSAKIKTIGASELDIGDKNNRKFDEKTPMNIKQLFVDMVNYDNKIKAEDYDRVAKKIQNEINTNLPLKMDRFEKAFDFIFDDIKFKGLENINNNIEILFEKNDKEISIDDLSSGEKQIVFRGAFLLRDKEALNGAVVLIDEPEISMHPEWQNKIMDFYKKIFQNKNGEQTSQIIVTTHSPFIIHNENRYNDKVIVLQKAEKGVKASDKPEYYNANTIQAVADAFNISNFLINNNENIVFLEGKTDEQYFNKACEVFGITDLPFVFKWIGHIGQNNQEEFTGKSSLNKAYSLFKGHNYIGKKVFLYDCDTNKSNEEENNCYIRQLSKNKDNKVIQIGIENLLNNISNYIDNNRSQFYVKKEKIEKDGSRNEIEEFDKQELCDFLCSLDNEQLKVILSNLKTEIDELQKIFK